MNRDMAWRALEIMYRIRLFEEKGKAHYQQNRLAGNFLGAFHSYIGQEAVATGVSLALRNDDYVFSTHRGHGHALARGIAVKKVMAELRGKVDGCSRGRGGSMHLFDPALGFLGGNGIVGGGLPLALGTAYAAYYRGTDQITVCFFGDGAASQGTFHESLNMAVLWKLPVVFVCENNGYAVMTPVRETICIPHIADRAAAYGMQGYAVDGNDVGAVYQQAEEAVSRARQGAGPTLLECKTYRIDSHCMMLPEIRAEKELAEWKAQDPIARWEKYLADNRIADGDAREELRARVAAEIEDADRLADESQYPDAAEFLEEIKCAN